MNDINNIMSQRPYPGLRPFTFEESDIFFGREEQTDQLLEKLADTRFISVVGLSGCGKSSLVRAGMIAALESGYLTNAGAHWRVAVMRPGNNPLRRLAEALLEDSAVGPERSQLPGKEMQTNANLLPFLLASLRRGPFGLVEILRETPLPKRTNLLILADQFEELFRYHREGGRDETETFVNLLLASAAQDEVPIYVVMTMRSEYIGDCALFFGLPEVMNRGQFLVPRLTRDQQEMAIIGPAGVFGVTVEPRLVNQLLNEMGNDPDQLPLLQHCLMRMWLQNMSSGEGEFTLTIGNYEGIGGLKKALSHHANEEFETLDETQRNIAETMFRCLTERTSDGRDIRRPASLKEIAEVADVSPLEVEEVSKVFRHPDCCFLIPSESEFLSPESMLDISHESLIRQWDKLRDWIHHEAESAEIYRNLEKNASQWQQKQVDLWGGLRLENALTWREQEEPTVRWAERYGENFDLAMRFLDACAQEEEEKHQREERERQRELKLKYARRQLIVVLLGLIFAVGLAVWGFWERSNAIIARTKVEQALLESKKAKADADAEKIRAEEALVETEKARKLAEEQKQQALNAEKKAKEAQEKAESNSLRFKEMVNATFGFLVESGQNKEFLNWTEKTAIIEKLNPALHLMIDLTEGLSEDEKKFWHTALPDMIKEEKLILFDILGEEAVEKTVGEEEFRITQVIIEDERGMTIEPVGDIYTIKAGELMTIKVDVAHPQDHRIEVIWTAGHGIISKISYNMGIYMVKSAGSDYVLIRIVDKDTGEELGKPLNIVVVKR